MGHANNKLSGSLKYVLAIIALAAAAIIGIEVWRRGAVVPIDAPQVINQINSAQPFPRELRDGGGEVLIIPAKPRRIVSQTLGTDEILLAICDSQNIIALSSLAEDEKYSNVAAEAKIIPGRATQGAEQILQMQPDLIFVASYSLAETVNLLKASRAPVFRFANFDSLEDIKNNVRTVGLATGCDAEADKLITKMNDELAAVRARIPINQPPPRVMSFSGDGDTAGDHTSFNDMVRAAGGINVSAENGINGFSKISAEKILEWQPDFIITGASSGQLENKRLQLMENPVIKISKAGKANHIIVIENRYYLAVSHHIVRGIENLADGFYGNSR